MKIYRGLAEVPPDFAPSALTIGNFDGVHYGHRRILRRVRETAQEHGWKASVLTFDPHPTRIVAPERAPLLMTSVDQRALLMGEEGIEQVAILPFTPGMAKLTPREFVEQIVAGRLGARAVLVGDNFRFGHKHAGDVRMLRELGGELGFATEIVPAVSCRGRVVSSSGIRELILAGRVSLAARYLQHPYSVAGAVVSGRGVGSRETVPTLNLATEADLIPARGVYVTRTSAPDGRRWNSITNIGYRPTFGDSEERSIETFLMDPLDGETPRQIRVEFLCRVREERKFPSPVELKQQILRDVRAAREYVRRLREWTRRPLAPA